MMRLALYEFFVKFKPGKENVVADFLSRLDEQEPSNHNEDYHDQLVANVEMETGAQVDPQ